MVGMPGAIEGIPDMGIPEAGMPDIDIGRSTIIIDIADSFRFGRAAGQTAQRLSARSLPRPATRTRSSGSSSRKRDVC
jgi:hypothetical protein